MELTWNAFVDTAATTMNLNGFKGFYSFYSKVLGGVESGEIVPVGFDAVDVCYLFSYIEDMNMNGASAIDMATVIDTWRK